MLTEYFIMHVSGFLRARRLLLLFLLEQRKVVDDGAGISVRFFQHTFVLCVADRDGALEVPRADVEASYFCGGRLVVVTR